MNLKAMLPITSIAALAFSGCLLGNSDGGGTASLGFTSKSRTYIISENRIIFQPEVKTRSYCPPDGALETVIDTLRSDSSEFGIEGDLLRVVVDTDSTESGAVVKEMFVFGRTGMGTGIEGTWNFRIPEYEVVSGLLTAKEKAKRDSGVLIFQYGMKFTTSSITLSKGTITTFEDTRTADLFMESWNGTYPFVVREPDSLGLDIFAKIIDPYTVELKGRKTGEIVRILMAPNRDRTYTSDKPGIAEYRHLRNPKSCPNDFEPQWFLDFEVANAK